MSSSTSSHSNPAVCYPVLWKASTRTYTCLPGTRDGVCFEGGLPQGSESSRTISCQCLPTVNCGEPAGFEASWTLNSSPSFWSTRSCLIFHNRYSDFVARITQRASSPAIRPQESQISRSITPCASALVLCRLHADFRSSRTLRMFRDVLWRGPWRISSPLRSVTTCRGCIWS